LQHAVRRAADEQVVKGGVAVRPHDKVVRVQFRGLLDVVGDRRAGYLHGLHRHEIISQLLR
jgi:hypothetical protein